MILWLLCSNGREYDKGQLGEEGWRQDGGEGERGDGMKKGGNKDGKGGWGCWQ